MENVFTPPESARDAFDILAGDLGASDAKEAAIDILNQLCEQVIEEDDLVETIEGWIEDDDAVLDHARILLAEFTYDEVKELGQGSESSYVDGLVTLWLANRTEGYGRDRPADGLYVEMKLRANYVKDLKLDAALGTIGVDRWNLEEVTARDAEWIYSDTLDWLLDMDWDYWLSAYPELTAAYRAGRIERSYKGVWLKPYVSIGEAIEAEHAISSGWIEHVRETLAFDWVVNVTVEQLRVVLDLEYAPEFSMAEGTTPGTINGVSDEDQAKLDAASELLRDGGKFVRHTVHSIEIE